MKFPSPFRLSLVLLAASLPLHAQESPEILASGEGIAVTQAEVEIRAKARLEDLEMERVRFEAEMIQKRHAALEGALQDLIADRVLELEATSRGITKAELLSEVEASAEEPSPEEVEAFFEKNKERIKGEKEELIPQIQRYLSQQRSREVRDSLLDELRNKYHVKSNLAPIRFRVDSVGHPSIGPENAPVAVVEFSDFECPYCSRVGPTLKQLLENYGEKVKLVYRQFPLSSIHKNAQKAAEASLCANDQNKFWEFHDWMFENQKKLSVQDLKGAAGELGLDPDDFSACLDSGKHAGQVLTDLREGMTAGVTGTPAFFVNGRPLKGAVEFETLAQTVEEELAAAQD